MANVSATEENTEPTKSGVVIEHLAGNDLSREEISAKIHQSLKARGIDATSMSIDLENLLSGSQKVFIMPPAKDLPLESNVEVYAEDHEFMPLTNEKTLSKKAARYVLNNRPNSALVTPRCYFIRPARPCTQKADRAFRAEQLPGVLKNPIGVPVVLNR